MKLFGIAALCALAAQPAYAQSFSCRIGTRPACLEYGDTVCSMHGRCVDSNAVCFDQLQCNYRGFTCRSNVDECVEANETLLRTHNALVDDYNLLLNEARVLREAMEEAQWCVLRAGTLEEAQSCL